MIWSDESQSPDQVAHEMESLLRTAGHEDDCDRDEDAIVTAEWTVRMWKSVPDASDCDGCFDCGGGDDDADDHCQSCDCVCCLPAEVLIPGQHIRAADEVDEDLINELLHFLPASDAPAAVVPDSFVAADMPVTAAERHMDTE
jgi:hypothetical protein